MRRQVGDHSTLGICVYRNGVVARVAARLLAAAIMLPVASLYHSCVTAQNDRMAALMGGSEAFAKDSDRDLREQEERERERAEKERERAEREREKAERERLENARRGNTASNSNSAAANSSSGTDSTKSNSQQSQPGKSNSSADSDDDEDDDDLGDDNGKDRRGSRGKSDSRRVKDVSDVKETPNTLVKLFKLWSSPGDGKKSPGEESQESASPDAEVGVVPSMTRRGQPDFELLALGNFKRHQIVASDLSESAISRARSLGFRASNRELAPGLKRGVRRLVIPRGMSEVQALALLREKFPEGHFGLNHVYHIVPAAEAGKETGKKFGADTSEKTEQDGTPGKSEGCKGDHCFAHALIGWRPQLKSCARRVRVGLIDTSFDTSHPAFAGREFTLGKFGSKHVDPQQDWHGTAVLSVLAGDSRSGTPGLVPEAQFLLASTFGTDSQGHAAADSIAVLRALDWLDSQQVEVVNMSFSGPPNDLIEAAIISMSNKGVIFVAAAGNGGVNGPASYPAAYPQVIAVTAIGKNRRSYRQANRGDYVDVAAPGVDVWTALPGGKHGYRTGTSFATPFVSGLLAAMPAARRNVHSKYDVLSRVTFRDLGAPGRDPIYGEGLPVAPRTCNEVGGVASLPWTVEHQRMSVGGPMPPTETWGADVVRPAGR